jgi:hypothetical protein
MRRTFVTIISFALLVAFGALVALASEPEYIRKSPPDPPKRFQERIEEIEKRIGEIRAKGRPQEKLMGKLEELRGKLAETEEKLDSLRETEPESPKIKELERRADELRKKIAELERALERRKPRPERRMPPREMPPEMMHMMKGELRIFKLEHVPSGYAAEILHRFISPRGVMVPEERVNLLIVRDLPEYIADIEEIIHHIDVPEIKRPPRGRPPVRRERMRERVERRAPRPKRQVARGEFAVKPGEERSEKIFRETDRPVTLVFKPSLKEEKVELKVRWGEKELIGHSELGKPAQILAHPDPKRADWGIKYEVNRTEDGRLKVNYEAWRYAPR